MQKYFPAVLFLILISSFVFAENSNYTIPYAISNNTQINSQTTSCPLYINTGIDGISQALDYSIPIWNIVIGPGISCDTISMAKWIVEYNFVNGSYIIEGIRLYFVFLLIILAIIVREGIKKSS